MGDWQREKSEDQARQQAARDEQAREDAATEANYRQLVSEGAALLDRFLSVMHEHGDPGLRKSGLFARPCWDGWLSPRGEKRGRTYQGKTVWLLPDAWLRSYMTALVDVGGGSMENYRSYPNPTGPKQLAKALGGILAENGIEL